MCIGINRKGIGTTFLVRNVVQGVPVEKRFPLYAPTIASLEVLRFQRGRSAKMYHIRDQDLVCINIIYIIYITHKNIKT